MRLNQFILLLGASLLLLGCAHNPWWEAERSGWAIFGADALVPRKAKPVPLNVLPEAAQWGEPIYVEAWIASVDQDNGEWMTISDGTSAPVTVLPEGGFTLPLNARGRRTMVWGRPLVASSTVESSGEKPRTSVQVELVAQSILIQGFYGLQAPPPSRFRAPAPRTTPTQAPQPKATSTEPEPEAQVDVDIEEVDIEEVEVEPEPTPTPAPIVDLPDR